MSKINWGVVQEGDVFFTRNNSPIGIAIRLLTRRNIQHVGQFIKPFGSQLFYRCEMVQDIFSKNDLKITNPIKADEIVSIKRTIDAYRSEEDRLIFRHRMIKWKEYYTIKYDNKELFSNIPVIGSKVDKDKKAMICSRLVYENMKLDGSSIKRITDFENAVTPADLYDSRYLVEVDGWKL